MYFFYLYLKTEGVIYYYCLYILYVLNCLAIEEFLPYPLKYTKKHTFAF